MKSVLKLFRWSAPLVSRIATDQIALLSHKVDQGLNSDHNVSSMDRTVWDKADMCSKCSLEQTMVH